VAGSCFTPKPSRARKSACRVWMPRSCAAAPPQIWTLRLFRGPCLS
jgi:hypothetical protein